MSTSQPPDFAQRRAIAQDTISRSAAIVQEHASEAATLDSSFLTLDQLPPLDASASPNFPPAGITVVNSDSFSAARKIIREHPEAHGRTAVLNLASDELPGGGWIVSLSKTQEEALCYSSTLYATLKPEYYPWPNVGQGSVAGIFSPGVVIFKDDLDHGCAELAPSDRRVVSVITVAAPCRPALTEDLSTFKDPSVLEDLRGKIRLVYRMAAHNQQQYLVLGAMGCGAYMCPPELVAREMKAALLDDEFRGWFRKVVFAVYSKGEIGDRNFDIFSRAFSKKFLNTS
ncbi:putative uncharacterized protein conserved in bacteria (DUF2263) [Lyophyllum shimeji]|uniref:Microbial-type PARG catalytic domain-containing protein n=1 Tax=Lyophyllum shimeji TaxID=47721 RepID=A0A9P3USL0_LYOSH|nr:putative uncharacterized protein conserved in bacteria (DUF2263) [Lyophyllum shimeji]